MAEEKRRVFSLQYKDSPRSKRAPRSKPYNPLEGLYCYCWTKFVGVTSAVENAQLNTLNLYEQQGVRRQGAKKRKESALLTPPL